MDTIKIYIDGKTYGENGSGFAVILLSKYNKWKRSFSHGNFTANYATLAAIKFAMLSISNQYKNMPIEIYTKNNYAIDMLAIGEDGFYKKVPNKYIELIEEVRDLTKGSKVIKSNDEHVNECSAMVEDAVKNHNPIDERN